MSDPTGVDCIYVLSRLLDDKKRAKSGSRTDASLSQALCCATCALFDPPLVTGDRRPLSRVFDVRSQKVESKKRCCRNDEDD